MDEDAALLERSGDSGGDLVEVFADVLDFGVVKGVAIVVNGGRVGGLHVDAGSDD